MIDTLREAPLVSSCETVTAGKKAFLLPYFLIDFLMHATTFMTHETSSPSEHGLGFGK
jgi:hypothetical protein